MSSHTNTAMILGFPDYREPAQNNAKASGIVYVEITIHHFPDGESKLQLTYLVT